MAKKSAASKGYRKTVKKKPFLSKKEIIALVIIVAAIVLGIVLFNLFYDDGYLGEKDVQPGDILTFANSDVRSRYAKLGTANELEGFTLEAKGNDSNAVVNYNYTPDAPVDHIDAVSLNGSFIPASELADSTIGYMEAYSAESEIEVSEKMEAEIQGRPAYIFSYSNNYYDASKDPDAEAETSATGDAGDAAEVAAEPSAEAGDASEAPAAEATEAPAEADAEAEAQKPSNVYSQNLSCYIAVDEEHTLCLHVYRTGEDASFYLPDDQVVDYVLQYADAFTLVEAEAK